jgi:acyl carrier protein
MSKQDLETFLVNFVVEQTGYPPEMVELDADLEADLGIDSIKKAQLFGELAEHFEVQATSELSLDDFPTLRHVVKFLEGVPQKGAAAAAVSAASAPAAGHSGTNGAAAAAKPMAPPPAPQAAPAAAVQAAPVAAAAPTSGLQGQDLEQFLVNFVVEQTGYPPEMVELDADLEADLGIDSIKKAQLFGELAEYFEVQATSELSLDDFPTLRHVLNFLRNVPQKGAAPAADRSLTVAATMPAPAAPAPQAAAAPQAVPQGNGAAQPAGDAGDLEDFLVNFVVEQTGYPPEMVELDADLEADLGIDSIKKAQLFGELAEYFEVQVSGELSLDDFPTLRHVLKFLGGVPRKMPV